MVGLSGGAPMKATALITLAFAALRRRSRVTPPSTAVEPQAMGVKAEAFAVYQANPAAAIRWSCSD